MKIRILLFVSILALCAILFGAQYCSADYTQCLISGRIIKIETVRPTGDAVVYMEGTNMLGQKITGDVVLKPYSSEEDRLHYEVLNRAFLSSKPIVITVYGLGYTEQEYMDYSVDIREVMSVVIEEVKGYR